MKIKYNFINNQFLSDEDSKLGISDLSIQRGYGIFDFLKTLDNKPVFLDDHLNRFFHSAKATNLEIPLGRQDLKDIIHSLMEKNNIPDSGIKLLLTGGYSEDGYTPGKPNLIITQTPLQLVQPNEDNGLSLITYEHQRQIPAAKTIDYVQAILLLPFLKANNGDDLLYHYQGIVRESPRSNFFMIADSEIVTPKTNILKGIIRSKILELKIPGYNTIERDFHVDDLLNAKEAFLSSTTKNAFPVVSIDGKPVGDGKIGKVVKMINDELKKIIFSVV